MMCLLPELRGTLTYGRKSYRHEHFVDLRGILPTWSSEVVIAYPENVKLKDSSVNISVTSSTIRLIWL